MNKRRFSDIVPITGMVLFWAITPVTIAWVKADFSLTFQVWLRYLSSSAVLWAVVIINKKLRLELSIIKQKSGYFLSRMLVIAICTISFQLFYTYCFFLIQPAFGILLYQSQAVFSLLTGAIFITAERKLLKSGTTITAIVMAVSGALAVILFKDEKVGFSMNAGVFMALLAAVSWSFVGLTTRMWLTDHLPPVLIVTIIFSMVSIILTPFAFLTGEAVIGNPGILKWTVLIGSGLLGIAGGQGLYYYLLPRIGIIIAASVQLLVPFATGILSYFFFGETINLIQITGGLTLLYGCRIIIKNKNKLQI